MIPRQEIYLHEHRLNLLVECIIRKDHAQIDNFCEAYDIPDDNDLRKMFHRLALAAADEQELAERKRKELEVEKQFADDDTQPIVPLTAEQSMIQALNNAASDNKETEGMVFFGSEEEMNQHIENMKKLHQ